MIWIIGGTCETVELVEKFNVFILYFITASTEAVLDFLDY